jgi:hypothetical protein
VLNPLQPLLERCSRGFTLPHKVAITIAAVLYIVCPLDFDFIPLIGWIDDVFVISLIRRVWTSPTLPPSSGGSGAAGFGGSQLVARH